MWLTDICTRSLQCFRVSKHTLLRHQVTLLLPLTSVHIDLVSLMRDQAAQTPVRKVKGISRCILVPVKDKVLADEGRVNFTAEGVNFYKMFENEDVSGFIMNLFWPEGKTSLYTNIQ